jgi:hypothetical protein
MKRGLLGSSALVGAMLAAHPALTGQAWAAEPIKLSVGGFFKEAYMVVIDDDGEGELGNERNTDGFFNDAEIHFVGSTVLDNGLEVGARVELEGETEEDQVDEAWLWVSGGFGEFRIGSDDDALANTCVVPPGGTGNFSAFSPNQWGANTSVSNPICAGVDNKGDAQKILYITPNFHGLQLTVSYTPDPDGETHGDGSGPHLGMTPKNDGTADYDASVYLTYSYEGENWGLTWGGGASFEGDIDEVGGGGVNGHVEPQDFYQTALTLTFGNFAIGGAFEYFNDATNIFASSGALSISNETDFWVAGGGIAYTYDAWTFGAQYSFREDDIKTIITTADDTFRTDIDQQQQRVIGTVNYALGPGISVDGSIAYTWIDIDPEDEDSALDDYDAFEIGIGTVITF